jgi:hypothetical protein
MARPVNRMRPVHPGELLREDYPVPLGLSVNASLDFWVCYRTLPSEVKDLADKSFALLKVNSRHPSLHFKKVGRFWSARVGLHYRALAVEAPDGLVWFWIGPHPGYEKLVG